MSSKSLRKIVVTVFYSRPIVHVVRKLQGAIKLKKGKNITYVEESLTRITDFGNLEDNRLEVLCKDATHNVESHVGQQQSIP